MEKTAFKTLQEIASIPVPRSEDYLKGYQAVSHISVINAIKEGIDKKGYGITREVYKVNSGGNIMYGSILTDMKSDNDLGGGFHFVNSYNKTKKLQIRAGAIVFLCDNGMVRMQNFANITRKHVGLINFEIDPMITNSINMLEEEYTMLTQAKNQLNQVDISKQIRAELAGRLFMEHELLSVTQMSLLKQEFNNPNSKFPDMNAWNLYNNVTEILKSCHPYDYIETHQEFHEIMMEEFV